MILGEKIGNKYSVNAECTFSKDELKEMLKSKEFNKITEHTVERLQFVAYTEYPDHNIVAAEDSKGRLHVTHIGTFCRSLVERGDFLTMKDIDFDSEITEPYDEFTFPMEYNPRAEDYVKKLREGN